MDNNIQLYSIEAEHAVLGAMLIDPSLIDSLVDNLTPDDFYSADHRLIFRRIIDMHNDNHQIDVITVSDGVTLSNQQGSLAYIGEIAANTPSTANATSYARIITERAVRRRMSVAGSDIQELARSSGSLQDQIAQANAMLTGIEASSSANEPLSIKQIMLDQMGEWEAREQRYVNGIKFHGLTTGFDDLDNMLSGMRAGQLIVIGGRPGSGKTTLGMNIAMNAAVNLNKSALVFSLEMSYSQLTDRLMASYARVDLAHILSGKAFNDTELSGKMTAAAGVLGSKRLGILDNGDMNINSIRSAARRHKHNHGLDLIVIDYLQLMSGVGKNDNRNEEVSAISRGAKLLARELGVPVLLLSQLNRDNTKTHGGDGRPKISHLRDSGSIEQDADVVLLVHRHPTEPDKPTEIIIGKNRDGETGIVPMAFIGQHNRFAPLDHASRDAFYDDLNKPKEKEKPSSFAQKAYRK